MDWYLLLGEGVQTVEDGVNVPDCRLEVENPIEIDPTGDLRIAANELGEICFLLPRAHRMALYEPIRVVACKARVDQRQQKAVAEDKAVARFEVPQHSLRIDDEAFDDPGKAVERVIERDERVGNDDPLSGRLRDVALVPERHVLQTDERVCAHDACEAADALGDLRIPFVRHRRRALHPFAERFLDLTHLGPCEMPNLGGETLE